MRRFVVAHSYPNAVNTHTHTHTHNISFASTNYAYNAHYDAVSVYACVWVESSLIMYVCVFVCECVIVHMWLNHVSVVCRFGFLLRLFSGCIHFVVFFVYSFACSLPLFAVWYHFILKIIGWALLFASRYECVWLKSLCFTSLGFCSSFYCWYLVKWREA